jgi:hypothetical protein
MNEKTVVITERDGVYQIQNNGISEFALLGILECIVFNMKSTDRREAMVEQQQESSVQQNNINQEQIETIQKPESVNQETKSGAIQEVPASDIRTRISNAVKAIRALGGRVEDADLINMNDEELQVELEELTGQYKRLKSSKAGR